MGTLAEFRGWLRLDLHDPAGAGERFSDAALDRAVVRAVAALSAVWPREVDTVVTLEAASRTVALAPELFSGLMAVAEVERPYGAAGEAATFPPELVGYKLAPDRGSVLLLTRDVPAVGEQIRVRWTAGHVVTAESSTVPEELDGLVALGAAGYAQLSYSTPAADNFKYEDGATVAGVDDSMIPKEWRVRGEAALARFREELGRLEQQRARSGRPWVTWSRRQVAPEWPVGGEGVEP